MNAYHILWVFLFTITGLSCVNPFAPRLDLESASSQCNDLTVIENVFCTFRQAYTFKDTTLYGNIIADDFTFTYRDYDRGVDVSWGRVDDMRSTYGLFQNVQSLQLIWNNIISASGGDTVQNVIRGFNLTVTINPNEINQVDGYANMTFVRAAPQNPWKLVRWRDESNY